MVGAGGGHCGAGQGPVLVGHWTQPGGGITPVIVSAIRPRANPRISGEQPCGCNH